ncbi:MAG: glycosyltransferase [Chloroflexaceae bacterium]|nr:glycosyltransferase [Chloroflexaceae bacterium]
MLLNQDTEVAPDWLAQLVAVFEAQAQAGIVGCKIFFPDGTTLQHTGGSLHWPLATPEHRGTGKTDSTQYDTVGHVEYVTGAAMAIRSVVLREVGLLDEGFSPAYFEDTDLCYRARAAGFEVLYTPYAHLLHHEGATSQSARHQRLYHRNRLRFVLKHAPLSMLLREFAPAETEEIERWSLSNSLARKYAYLDNLLNLNSVLAQRSGDAAEALVARPQLVAMLRRLHSAVVVDENRRRSEGLYSSAPPDTSPAPDQPEPIAPLAMPDTPLPHAAPHTDVPGEDATPAPVLTTAEAAPIAKPTPVDTTPEAEPSQAPAVPDVTEIMRQVRRQIAERQGRNVEGDLRAALDALNQQWNTIYEPLHLAPGASQLGRLWEVARTRFHHEVRGYLDPMIYRQTEFNANTVRALNNMLRRSEFAASTVELESLRDEVIQLREQVRLLQEQLDQQQS